MKIADCMSRDVLIIKPSSTLYDAAAVMADADSALLLVGDSNHLFGTVTDRDIVVRGVGTGKRLDALVSEVMSELVLYCYADQDVDRVAASMVAAHIQRLAVLDSEERPVGVVSISDMAQAPDAHTIRTPL